MTGNEAFAAAATMSNSTHNAYLVTITSAAENNIVMGLSQTIAWIGAKRTSPGVWSWQGGDDTNVQFWSGGPAGSGGNVVNNMYSNWLTNQPDGEICLVINAFGLGMWSDWGDCGGNDRFPFFVEFSPISGNYY